MPYDAVNGHKMMVSYGVDPYHIPYRLQNVLDANGTDMVAVHTVTVYSPNHI